MKPLLIYLFEVLLCSSLFLALYRLLLAGRVSFGLCRRFLLVAMVAAMVIPALRIPVYPAPERIHIASVTVAEAPVADQLPAAFEPVDQEITSAAVEYAPPVDWRPIAAGLYGVVVVLLFVQVLRRLYVIRRIRRTAHLTRCEGYTLAESRQVATPFSFLRTIYLGTAYDANDRARIVCHEASHIRHRHSAERLVMEVLRCVCWMNPFVWIASRWLSEVQEWEADRDVLDAGCDLTEYRTIIFRQLFGCNPDMTCGLNHSFTKKRFAMMTQFKRSKHTLMRLGAVIPVAAMLVVLCSFTTRAPKSTTQQVSLKMIRPDTLQSDSIMMYDVTQIINIKADTVYPRQVGVPSSPIVLTGNVRIDLQGQQVLCDSAVRYTDGSMEWFGDVQIVVPGATPGDTNRFLVCYAKMQLNDGKMEWSARMADSSGASSASNENDRSIRIGDDGLYVFEGESLTLSRLAGRLAAIPAAKLPLTMITIIADPKTPVRAVNDLKDVLRKAGIFRVAYHCSGEARRERMLSPMPGSKSENGVKVLSEGDVKIKERNLFLVKVNSKGEILAGTKGHLQLVGLTGLKEQMKAFLVNADNNPDLSEQHSETMKMVDQKQFTHSVSRGIVSYEVASDLDFGTYMQVQNTLYEGLRELRDAVAREFFGKPYGELETPQAVTVQHFVTIPISEAEPHDTK